jgi:hypothetical protein
MGPIRRTPDWTRDLARLVQPMGTAKMAVIISNKYSCVSA